MTTNQNMPNNPKTTLSNEENKIIGHTNQESKDLPKVEDTFESKKESVENKSDPKENKAPQKPVDEPESCIKK